MVNAVLGLIHLLFQIMHAFPPFPILIIAHIHSRMTMIPLDVLGLYRVTGEQQRFQVLYLIMYASNHLFILHLLFTTMITLLLIPLLSSLIIIIIIAAYMTTYYAYSTYAYSHHLKRIPYPHWTRDSVKMIRMGVTIWRQSVLANLNARFLWFIVRPTIWIWMRPSLHPHHPHHPHHQYHQKRDKHMRVMVFVHGGAWIWGHPQEYVLMTQFLETHGYRVIHLDYPKYDASPPHDRSDGGDGGGRGGEAERKSKSVGEMVSAIKKGLEGVYSDLMSGPGDGGEHGRPVRVYLVGHSAGAHLLISTLLLHHSTLQLFQPPHTHPHPHPHPHPSHSYRNNKRVLLERVILMAGIYNLPAHFQYERSRLMDDLSGLGRACGPSRNHMHVHSPQFQCTKQNVCSIMNGVGGGLGGGGGGEREGWQYRVVLVHGCEDETVPPSQSIAFYNQLRSCESDSGEGKGVKLVLAKGVDHTELLFAFMSESYRQVMKQKAGLDILDLLKT